MKKRIGMFFAAAMATMPLMAETETVGGYTWTGGMDGETVEIMV